MYPIMTEVKREKKISPYHGEIFERYFLTVVGRKAKADGLPCDRQDPADRKALLQCFITAGWIASRDFMGVMDEFRDQTAAGLILKDFFCAIVPMQNSRETLAGGGIQGDIAL